MEKAGVDEMKFDINNPKPLPDRVRLRDLLNYTPETGALIWISGNRKDLIGSQCGSLRKKDNYYVCTIDKERFAVHRVIYKWMTGEEPNVIDHINGNPKDNRWFNIRSVTSQENNFNMGLMKDNKTGVCGVSYREDHDRYIASVRIGKKSLHLGSFKTIKEAEAARKAANVIFGFSDRHGKVA